MSDKFHGQILSVIGPLRETESIVLHHEETNDIPLWNASSDDYTVPCVCKCLGLGGTFQVDIH